MRSVIPEYRDINVVENSSSETSTGEGLPDGPETWWARLQTNPNDQDAVEMLVRHYLFLVGSELSRARSRLPSYVDRDELEIAGSEGLFLAVTAFDQSLGVSFEHYARRRIRGSMLDCLRRLDGVPRTARQPSKTLAKATQQFKQRTSRNPSSEELAEEAGIQPDELSTLERQAQSADRVSIDAANSGHASNGSSSSPSLFATLATPERDGPLAQLALAELKDLLVQALKKLSDRERSILVLYYYEGVMFNEIAAAMAVSESRISQLHARALARLKSYINGRRISSDDDEPDGEDEPA